MRKTKLWLITIAALLGSMTVSAGSPGRGYHFIVDDIYYWIISETDLTVQVSTESNYSFGGDYSEEIIVIPETVEYNNLTYRVVAIGDHAFENCYNLTSITIPTSVTSIGSSAFSGCRSLTDITIPESVTSIGGSAFSGCNGLTAVYISSIEAWCNIDFDIYDIYDANPLSCAKNLYINGDLVTELTIPNSVDTIKNYAFHNCSNLTSITIPESVTSIGVGALSNCSSLTTIIVAEGNKVYDSRNGCNAIIETSSNSLVHICPATIIPESVTSIGSAFSGWSSLTSITIPEGVTNIGSSAFDGCSSLTSITIPEGVTSIGYSAFDGCSSLIAITLPEGVTSIGGRAFYGCSSLTAITIPEGVTSIGHYAFYGCSSLTSITIPEGVTSIVYHAFSGCSSLTSITIPTSVTSIRWNAFSGCNSLTSITIPEGVTSIESSAFYGCSSLRKVINFSNLDIQRGSSGNGYIAYYAYEVINNATPVGDYGFHTTNGTNYLICYFGTATELSLPENYNGDDYEIAAEAFRGNSTITSIVIPEGVTSIGYDAFYGCSSLASIVIPEGVTSIEDVAFYGCNNLKLVINYSDLPLQRGSSSYGYVGYYADRVINVDNFIGDYAFKTKDGVHYLTGYIGDDTELTLPNDYQGENYQIGESAFNNCSSLTSITIPEKLTSIQRYTFSNCSGLKELTLGKGLKKIDEGSFFSSTGLEKITIYATQPPRTDGYIFPDEVYENATLYVPQGSVSKYQVMTGWSGFYNISEIEGGTPDYLTIRQADNGEVGIAVDLGRTYRVRIAASEGWKVHSITFDGVDMTAKLDEDGTFTTPTLNGSAVLNVAYEQEDGSRVTDTLANAIRVSGHEGVITVDGCVEGENIAVYTTDGTAVAEVQATGTNTEITVESHRLYIVRVATKVVKIRM